MVAQGYIHKNISTGSLEAHDERFRVFTAFASLLGGMHCGRPNVEMKSLIIQRGDGIADDLVGELADRLAYKLVIGLGDLDARQAASQLCRGWLVHIKNYSPFDLAGEANLGGDSLPPVG